MSFNNILVLIVLIGSAVYNTIQAGIIRDVDIPKLDVNKMVGKWYLLTSDKNVEPYDGLACTTYHIESQSSNTFTFKKTETLTPETKALMPDIEDEHSEVVNCRILMDSNVIMMGRGYGYEGSLVIFDLDYDSHMATYLTSQKEDVYEGNIGDVSIFSRNKTLPESVIDKIKRSNFYLQGVSAEHKSTLRIKNITDCP